jgi:hypothetical protein
MAFKTAKKICKRMKKHSRKLAFEYAHRLHRWKHKKEYSDQYLIFLSDLFSDRPVKRNYNFFSYFVKKS